ISHKVRVDDRKEVCDDFKMVYQASSKEVALEARGTFAEKWKTVAKEAIHIAVGIRPDGSKEVLSYAIAPTESITIWEEILLDLQERGLKNVLLFITDGLKGMVGAISRFYPKARFQHCCVHVSRNISHKVRVDDRKEVCDDFKMVYQASSKKVALEARGTFAEKWKT
ncbi:transposase, partial [Enterococcus faecium]|uniref:transposase n=1 Tax=Enterococcus faecium TaxID=1352 RepID=UPI000A6AC998